MITLKEFYETECDNVVEELFDIWGVQKNEKGEFLYEPFEALEEFIDGFEAALDDPYDKIEDKDWEHEEEYHQDSIKRITEAYETIKAIREEFKAKHPNYDFD